MACRGLGVGRMHGFGWESSMAWGVTVGAWRRSGAVLWHCIRTQAQGPGASGGSTFRSYDRFHSVKNIYMYCKKPVHSSS